MTDDWFLTNLFDPFREMNLGKSFNDKFKKEEI